MNGQSEAQNGDWIKRSPQVYEQIAYSYHESRYGNKWGKYDLVETIHLLFVLLKELNLKPRTHKALDLACGTGKLSLPLAQSGVDVTCLDAAKGMLEQCSLRAEENHLEQFIHPNLASADKLPYAADTFDFVVSSRFLLLFPLSMYPVFLNEMLRVTKPGGYVIVEVKNKYFGLSVNYFEDKGKIQRGEAISSSLDFTQLHRLQDGLIGGRIVKIRGCLLPRANLFSKIGRVAALLRALSHTWLSPITFSFFVVIQKKQAD